MSFSELPGQGNPELFRVLFEIFSDPKRLQWELASELARHTASEADGPENVDPLARMRMEEICKVADMHVSSSTGLDTTVGGKLITPEAVSAPEWAVRTLAAWQPLLSVIVESHTQPIGPIESTEFPDGTPPNLAKIFGQAAQAIGPAMLGMQLGTSIGFLARRAMGQYELPIPRPQSAQLLFVTGNISAFAEDWSLPLDDVFLWVSVREIALHTVLGIAHVRDRINSTLEDYARKFSPDPNVVEDRLNSLDFSGLTDIEDLQKAFGDPSEMLNRMITPEQRDSMELASALVAVVEGWVDHITEKIGRSLISSFGPLDEALRRQRVVRGEGEKYIDLLFGLTMDQDQFDRGNAFVKGVLERSGEEGLARLWTRAEHLPTPAEADAPGLWLERISYLS